MGVCLKIKGILKDSGIGKSLEGSGTASVAAGFLALKG
jgi:hypothetical protein